VLLKENLKSAKKLTFVLTNLFVGGFRGIPFSRKSIANERAFLHSSRYVV
jgi:hypothetical protein